MNKTGTTTIQFNGRAGSALIVNGKSYAPGDKLKLDSEQAEALAASDPTITIVGKAASAATKTKAEAELGEGKSEEQNNGSTL